MGEQDMTSNDVLASSSCVRTAVATFLKHSSYQRSAVFNYDFFFLLQYLPMAYRLIDTGVAARHRRGTRVIGVY